MDILQPKNGVLIRNNKQAIGSGKFINDNASKMSLKQYQSIAISNSQSLAHIALRGVAETQPHISFQMDTGVDPFTKRFNKMTSRSGLNSGSFVRGESDQEEYSRQYLKKSEDSKVNNMSVITNDKIFVADKQLN
jgi:hypothetical protein